MCQWRDCFALCLKMDLWLQLEIVFHSLKLEWPLLHLEVIWSEEVEEGPVRHGNQQHLLLKQQHKVQAVEAEKSTARSQSLVHHGQQEHKLKHSSQIWMMHSFYRKMHRKFLWVRVHQHQMSKCSCVHHQMIPAINLFRQFLRYFQLLSDVIFISWY